MRYWVYQDSRIHGPYSREDLASVPGLSGASLVCPDKFGGVDDKEWRPLDSVSELNSLFARSGVPMAPAIEKHDPEESFQRFRDEAHAALDAGGWSGEWVSGSLEHARLFAPWEPMVHDLVDPAREEERGRAEILEAELLRLRRQLEEYEQRQNEILERLSEKDRQLEEMRSGFSAPAAVPEPTLDPAPRAQPSIPAFAPPPAVEAFLPPAQERAPAAVPPPSLPDLPSSAPLTSALRPPQGQAFTPPVPATEPSGEEVRPPDAVGMPPAEPSGEEARPPDAVATPPAAAEPVAQVQVQPEVDLVILEEGQPAPETVEQPAAAPAPTPSPVEAISLEPAPAPVVEEAAPPPAQTGAPPGPMRTMVFTPPAGDEGLVALSPISASAQAEAPAGAASLSAGWGAVAPSPAPAAAAPVPVLPSRTIGRFEPKATESLSPAPRKRPPAKGFLIGMGVAVAALALVAFFLRDPKQARQMINMAPETAAPKGTSLAELEPARPPREEPRPAQSAQPEAFPQPQPAAQPAPAAPAPRSKDFVDSQNVRAIELVKNHRLEAQRSTVANWLQYSFSSQGYAEEWSAGGYEANIFYVEYRVFRAGAGGRGDKPVVTYLFEADLAAGKVTGKNAEARALLAGGAARAPQAKGKREAPRRKAPVRRRRVRPAGPEPLPEEEDLAAAGGEQPRFNNPAADEEALTP